MGSTQQEVGYSGLFKKHMLWNLKYSSQNFQHTSTKLCERDLKTLEMLNCGGIFDIWNGFCPWRGDEVMARIEIQEVSNKVHIHCLILITLQWFVRYMKHIALMWQLWGKVIAPPTGSRKCVIFKMLWIQHLTFAQFASNFIRIISKHGRCETVKGILISKILLPWQRVKPQYSFLVILRLSGHFWGA